MGAPQPTTRSGGVVATLAIAGTTAAIMQTLVTPLIAELPQILSTTPSNAAWVITVTLLVSAVCVPVSGRLGDMVGKRRMLLVCSVPLIAGSVVCALSSSVVPMIVGRGLQGMGMGVLPLGIALLRDVVPAEKLSSSIALVSASMGIGGALGLPIAAAVAQYTNWRVLFWGSAGLATVVAVLIWFLIPDVAGRGQGAAVRRARCARPRGGPGLPAARGLQGRRLGLGFGHHARTVRRRRRGAARLGAVGAAYPRPAGRSAYHRAPPGADDQPRLRLRRLRHVRQHADRAAAAPAPLRHRLRPGPVDARGGPLAGARRDHDDDRLPLGGKLIDARGPKFTLVCGILVIAVGYGLALVLMGSAWGLMVVGMVTSSGVGLAYGAMPALIMGSVPLSETAAANGFNTLMRSLGTSIGAAVVGVVLSQMTVSMGGYDLTSENGFRTGLMVGCGVALVAAVIAAAIPAARRAEPGTAADAAAEQAAVKA